MAPANLSLIIFGYWQRPSPVHQKRLYRYSLPILQHHPQPGVVPQGRPGRAPGGDEVPWNGVTGGRSRVSGQRTVSASSSACPRLSDCTIYSLLVTRDLPLLSRLRNVSTDLLVTVNVPYPDESSAANSSGNAMCFVEEDPEHREEGDSSQMNAAGGSSGARGGPERAPGSEPKVDVEDKPGRLAISTLRTLLKSFAILDWSLFD